MALIALINLVLVLYDLSYISLRDAYLKHLPKDFNQAVTIPYGEKIKGIQPDRLTTNYLEIVDQLKTEVSGTGIEIIGGQ